MIDGIDPKSPITHQKFSNLSFLTPSRHIEHSSLNSMKKKSSRNSFVRGYFASIGSAFKDLFDSIWDLFKSLFFPCGSFNEQQRPCMSRVTNYFVSIAADLMDILYSGLNILRALSCFPSKALSPKQTLVQNVSIDSVQLNPNSDFGSLIFEKTADNQYKINEHNHLIFKRQKAIEMNDEIYEIIAKENVFKLLKRYFWFEDRKNELEAMNLHPIEYLYYVFMTENRVRNIEIFKKKTSFANGWKQFIDEQVLKFNKFTQQEIVCCIPDFCKLLKLNQEPFLLLAKDKKWAELIGLTFEEVRKKYHRKGGETCSPCLLQKEEI